MAKKKYFAVLFRSHAESHDVDVRSRIYRYFFKTHIFFRERMVDFDRTATVPPERICWEKFRFPLITYTP